MCLLQSLMGTGREARRLQGDMGARETGVLARELDGRGRDGRGCIDTTRAGGAAR